MHLSALSAGWYRAPLRATEVDALSIAMASAFTLALLGAVSGLAWRMFRWARTPNPLPIPLAPAPRGYPGVAMRLVIEIFLFRSLARASPVTWLPSMLMHYALLLIVLMHLRFVFERLPLWLLPLLRISGWLTAFALLGLGVLLFRRIRVERVRYVSAPSDYLHLLLLIGIVLSGAALQRWGGVDLYRVGEFVRGVLTFDWQALPAHAGLIVHLLCVLVLLVVLPISKLVHAPGIAFAPTFHQRDRGRSTPGSRGKGDG